MKRNFKYLIIGAALVLGACSSDDTDNITTSPTEISLNGDIVSLRGPYSTGVAFTLTAIKEGSQDLGHTFIPASKAVLESDNSITTPQTYYWPINGDALRFYGFMKASDNASASFTHTNGDLLLTAGVGSDHDFLLSNNLSASANSSSNKMSFRHLMTQLKITVTADPDVDLPVTLKGSIAGGKTTGTYSIFEETATAAIMGGENYSPAFQLTVDNAVASSNIIYHLVPDNTTTISSITSASVNNIAADNITIVPPMGGSNILLTAGVSYEVAINISRRGVASATVTVKPWDNIDLGSSTGEVDASNNYNIVWDAQGADITAVEIVDDGGKTGLLNVKADSQTAGNGATEGSLKTSTTLSNLSVFHKDTKVDLGAAGTLWSYNNTTKTITVNAVLVSNKDELAAINTASNGLDKTYFQVCDIDLENDAWTPIGDFDSTTPFAGTYDGLSFNISNLNVDSPTTNYNSLFAYSSGTIKNVRVVSGTVKGKSSSAGIVAVLQDGVVENCYNAAQVNATSNNVGGIVGNALDGTVTNCHNIGSISTTGGYAGGILGKSESTTVTVSLSNNEGSVYASQRYIGGIVGHNLGLISSCNNNGAITSALGVVGGIVGESNGHVLDCRNYGTILNTGMVAGTAGIAGQSQTNGTIKGCHNEGNVSGTNDFQATWVAGICGLFNNPTANALYDCSNSGDIYSLSGSVTAGIVAQNNGSGTKLVNTGSVTSPRAAGGIAGNNQGSLSDCRNDGEIIPIGDGIYDRQMMAGIVVSNVGSVFNCVNNGNVSGSQKTGGIAASVSASAKVELCVNNGKITGKTGDWYTAGISASNSGLTLGCLNNGEVVGGYATGGIVGFNEGSVVACANKNNVSTVNSHIGGVVGYSSSAVAATTACYNTGDVTGYFGGGVIGYSDVATQVHTANYNLGNVTGGNSGPILGFPSTFTVNDCYYGGNSPSTSQAGATQFSDAGQWPTSYWTSLSGNGVAAYWKSLGGWASGGTPTYPTLYWE